MRASQARRDGREFSPTDLIDLGSRDAVDKALSRMAATGTIRRVARGLYDVPRQHPIVEFTNPSTNWVDVCGWNVAFYDLTRAFEPNPQPSFLGKLFVDCGFTGFSLSNQRSVERLSFCR